MAYPFIKNWCFELEGSSTALVSISSSNFTPIPRESTLTTLPLTVMSFSTLGREKTIIICWPIWKLPSVWIKTPSLLIFWITYIKLTSLLVCVMGNEKGFRGNFLNSNDLEWYQITNFFSSSRLSVSDILEIDKHRSFLFSISDA